MYLPQIKAALESAQKVAVFGHEHIDGDALGAILAMGKFLEKQGKQVSYFTPHHPSVIFDFLKLGDKVQTEFDYGDYDLLVFLDFNQYARIWLFAFGHEDYFDALPKVIIDHHQPEAEPKATLIYRDVESISTCSLLFELTQERRAELMDEEIATRLYMGLSTDSGNFRYDEGQQSIRTFRVAMQLLEFWAKKKLIIDEIFRSKSYRSVQFMQLLLSRMQKIKIQTSDTESFNLIYSFYEDSELEQFALDHDEADYGLYIMQDIRHNQLVLLIKKVGIFVKTSLRGRGQIDCSALARALGGGGHFNAAGFKMQGSGYLEKDVQEILAQVKAYFAQK